MLIGAFQSALERSDIQQAWDDDLPCSKIMIWVFYMGGLASASAQEVQWYAACISRHTVRLNLSTWPGFKACLSEVLWTEKMHDQASENLWQEIEILENI